MNTNHYSILAHLMLYKITDINLLVIQLAIALIEHNAESRTQSRKPPKDSIKKVEAEAGVTAYPDFHLNKTPR